MYDDLKKEFFSLFHAIRKMRGGIPHSHNLPMMESVVLRQIAMFANDFGKSEVRVSDLTAQMGITKSAVSQTLNSLENKGYIQRHISAGDRRAVAITITSEGAEIFLRHMQEMDTFLDKLIEGLGEDKSRTLVNLLSEMLPIIKEIKHNEETLSKN